MWKRGCGVSSASHPQHSPEAPTPQGPAEAPLEQPGFARTGTQPRSSTAPGQAVRAPESTERAPAAFLHTLSPAP